MNRAIFPLIGVLFLFSLFSFIFTGTAFAKISLVPYEDPANMPPSENVFTGTLVMTAPDGRITIVEPGDPIPEIESGSTLEVFDGYFTIQTEEGDHVTVSVLGNEFIVANGAVASAIAGETEGRIIVRKGFARYTDEAGRSGTVPAPQDFPVVLGEPLSALPTAEGSPVGFDVGGEPVPDSRNIEASPSA